MAGKNGANAAAAEKNEGNPAKKQALILEDRLDWDVDTCIIQ
jgi:hypothetical protein